LTATVPACNIALKGIGDPIELFEPIQPHASREPPADGNKGWRVVQHDGHWLPATDRPHSLPAERDHFIGRQTALHELAARFERGARLVSLLGPGGTGKTRLAVRNGWIARGEHPGGVWFCDLPRHATSAASCMRWRRGCNSPCRAPIRWPTSAKRLPAGAAAW
jgi:hypothetical protein